jgi:hypothetical protein
MNGTTKQRYISTSIWDDDWFDSLTEREKLVYFYLLTNTHTNPAGVYQCTLKNIRLEIGLEREEIERIMAKFEVAGKAFYYCGYIIIPKWLNHQRIGDRSTLFLGAVKVLKSLPDDVKKFISDRRHYDYDVSNIIGSEYPIDNLSQNNNNLSISYQENDKISTHDIDFDLDIDSDVVVDHRDISSCEEKPPDDDSKTTTDILSIQAIAKGNGFFLTDSQAGAFHCLDPAWLSGDFNFLVFAAEKINADTSKTHGDHERIFAKSWSYQNLLQEYPAWLKKKKTESIVREKSRQKAKTEQEKQRQLRELRKHKHKTCTHCGVVFKNIAIRGNCPSCGWDYILDEEKVAFVFREQINLQEAYRNMLREKHSGI